MRVAWRLYPERLEISSTSVISIVNVSLTLKQALSPNEIPSISSIDNGALE